MTRPHDTLRFLVDDVREMRSKSMLPGSTISNLVSKSVDIAVETFTDNISDLLTKMLDAVSSVPIENDKWSVDSVRFTVAITSKGSLSVVSVIHGELGGQSGLEFTLRRKS